MDKSYIIKTLKSYSFKRPSFMEGVARIFDWSQTMRLSKVTVLGNGSNDRKALASDWKMVGRDLKQVMGEYGPTAKPHSGAQHR